MSKDGFEKTVVTKTGVTKTGQQIRNLPGATNKS